MPTILGIVLLAVVSYHSTTSLTTGWLNFKDPISWSGKVVDHVTEEFVPCKTSVRARSLISEAFENMAMV